LCAFTWAAVCLPRALLATAEAQGCPLELVEATHDANTRQRVGFANGVVPHYRAGSILAVWSLAFKARTDDVRESPAMLKVRAYDPEARDTARMYLGTDVTLCSNAHEAAAGADGLVVATEWQEFRSPGWTRLQQIMRRPVIFDGRNLYDPRGSAERRLRIPRHRPALLNARGVDKGPSIGSSRERTAEIAVPRTVPRAFGARANQSYLPCLFGTPFFAVPRGSPDTKW
jgi:hypothetical protein